MKVRIPTSDISLDNPLGRGEAGTEHNLRVTGQILKTQGQRFYKINKRH